MKVANIRQDKNAAQAQILVEIANSEWDTFFHKANEQLAKTLDIKGFRKGHVPLPVAEKYINKKQIEEKTLDLIKYAAIAKVEEEKYKYPPFIYTKFSVNNVKRLPEKKITLQIEYETRPEVSQISDWKKAVVTLNKINVNENEISARIKHDLQNILTTKTPKQSSDSVQSGDEVVIDFQGFIDGKKFPGGEAKKFNLLIGSKTFVGNFEDQLIGMKIGKEKEIAVVFPKDYQVKTLQSKKANFIVKLHTINSVKEKKVTDEAIKKLNIANVTTIDQYKNYLRERFLRERERKENEHVGDTVIIHLKNHFKRLFPPSMLEIEKLNFEKDFKKQLEMSKMTLEQWLKVTNQTMEKFKNDVVLASRARLDVMFILSQIADDEKITITDDEFNRQLVLISDTEKKSLAEIKQRWGNEPQRSNLINQLRHQKAWMLVQKTCVKRAENNQPK